VNNKFCLDSCKLNNSQQLNDDYDTTQLSIDTSTFITNIVISAEEVPGLNKIGFISTSAGTFMLFSQNYYGYNISSCPEPIQSINYYSSLESQYDGNMNFLNILSLIIVIASICLFIFKLLIKK